MIQEWDEKILLSMNGWLGDSSALDMLVELVAVYTIYAVPVILILLWFRQVREAGIRAALAGLTSWIIVSPLIAAIWFRTRPSLAELGGQELLFHRPTYSFPSDHAGFLAALTVTFYLNKYPKIAAAFFVLTLLVAVARVALGFHYPTDILGGLVVGSLIAGLVHSLREPIDRFLSHPAIRLAQKLKLA